MNNDNLSSWVKVVTIARDIPSILTILALIIYSILLIKAPPTEKVSFGLEILLGLLILCVVLLALKKALNPPAPVKVNLVFKESPGSIEIPGESIDLDNDNCAINVRELEGQKKSPVIPNLLFDETIKPRAWYFNLTNIESSDGVSLDFIDRQKVRWRSKPFTPYQKRVELYPDSGER